MIRLVPLDAPLLALAIEAERDPVTRAFARATDYAQRVLAGLGFAALEDGMFLAAGGLILHWPGRAEAWCLISEAAGKRQLVQAVRLARAVLDTAQGEAQFRRIEMFVCADAPWRFSFLEALGFQLEGVLKAWDPIGRDMLLCARISSERMANSEWRMPYSPFAIPHSPASGASA